MKALQHRGHHLSLLSLHPLGSLGPQLLLSGIPAVGIGYAQVPLWRWLCRLRHELHQQAPDALLLTGHSLPVLLAVLGFCRGRRLLAIHFHHSGVKPQWFWKFYYALACRLVNAVTFPSDFVRHEAVRIYPRLNGKAHTLRNPIDPVPDIAVAERRAARVRFGIPSDVHVIGNAGWLIPRKRFDVFLETAALILKQRTDVRFLIAGDGPSHAMLQRLANQLGIDRSIIWIGWISDMRQFYASLDLLLFNSDWDALGLTPIEATVHGIPVVGSVLNGGLSELLRPGIDALLIDSHDETVLAQSCLSLIDDSSSAQSMVSRGREHVLSLSSSSDLARWHEQMLQGA